MEVARVLCQGALEAARARLLAHDACQGGKIC